MHRCGQLLETPLGVAAGPHTQLSQNLIAAWLTGARYMELKTVQVLDELEVTKPCIDMADEGYNCEWSQELKLEQSFDEYLNAWIVLHVLKDQFGWGRPGRAGIYLQHERRIRPGGHTEPGGPALPGPDGGLLRGKGGENLDAWPPSIRASGSWTSPTAFPTT